MISVERIVPQIYQTSKSQDTLREQHNGSARARFGKTSSVAKCKASAMASYEVLSSDFDLRISRARRASSSLPS